MQNSDLGRGARVPDTLGTLTQVGRTCSRNQNRFVLRSDIKRKEIVWKTTDGVVCVRVCMHVHKGEGPQVGGGER